MSLQEQKNKICKICGPCFLNQIIYHELQNCVPTFTLISQYSGVLASPIP